MARPRVSATRDICSNLGRGIRNHTQIRQLPWGGPPGSGSPGGHPPVWSPTGSPGKSIGVYPGRALSGLGELLGDPLGIPLLVDPMGGTLGGIPRGGPMWASPGGSSEGSVGGKNKTQGFSSLASSDPRLKSQF